MAKRPSKLSVKGAGARKSGKAAKTGAQTGVRIDPRALLGDAARLLQVRGLDAARAELTRVAGSTNAEKAVPMVQRLLLLARSAAAQHPQRALEVCQHILKTYDAAPVEVLLIAGALQDRLGDRRASEVSMRAVVEAERATPAEKLRAANLLVRFGEQELALKAGREAFDAMGRPLNQAATLLYIAQVSADWDLVDQLTAQLTAAYAKGEVATINETPRTHLLWCDDEDTNIAVLKNWSARNLPPVSVEPPPVQPLQGRKIRLGYLSSDFREHPTARLVNGLLRHHDRTQFELFMYCSGWDDGSPMRREVESHFDHIHSVAKLSDAEAAQLIRSHGVDVLVELNGPTRANRMGVLSYRPAPVQIDYLGWPGSVGGRVVDYVVGDAITVPPGAEAAYPEQVIRLSKVYQVNDYAARAMPPKPTRAEVGLPDGDYLVLGMFNAINKVHNEVWDVWMQILKAVPNALLWILDPGPQARKLVAKAALARGVSIKRILAAPRLAEEQHLARLQLCDLMLDPWPYGGHTSTADALFAGVPVVALDGKNFASRVSGALLRAAGLSALVHQDRESYARFAAGLLRNPAELERVKAFVREQVPKTDVFNAKGKARQLEAAYRDAVERVAQAQVPGFPHSAQHNQDLMPDSLIKKSRDQSTVFSNSTIDKSDYQKIDLMNSKVSVIVPTYGRQHLFPLLYKCFINQSYNNCELLIFDDSTEPSDFFSGLSKVKYFHSNSRLSIGEKRNFLVNKSEGDVIAHFDDDDFYSPDYLKFMLSHLENADFVNLTGWFVYAVKQKEFGYWQTDRASALHYVFQTSRPIGLVKGGPPDETFSLGYGFNYIYRKSVWLGTKFPDRNHGEDYEWVKNFGPDVIKKSTIDDRGLALHIIHSNNTSRCFPQYRVPSFLVGQIFGDSIFDYIYS